MCYLERRRNETVFVALVSSLSAAPLPAPTARPSKTYGSTRQYEGSPGARLQADFALHIPNIHVRVCI